MAIWSRLKRCVLPRYVNLVSEYFTACHVLYSPHVRQCLFSYVARYPTTRRRRPRTATLVVKHHDRKYWVLQQHGGPTAPHTRTLWATHTFTTRQRDDMWRAAMSIGVCYFGSEADYLCMYASPLAARIIVGDMSCEVIHMMNEGGDVGMKFYLMKSGATTERQRIYTDCK